MTEFRSTLLVCYLQKAESHRTRSRRENRQDPLDHERDVRAVERGSNDSKREETRRSKNKSKVLFVV